MSYQGRVCWVSSSSAYLLCFPSSPVSTGHHEVGTRSCQSANESLPPHPKSHPPAGPTAYRINRNSPLPHPGASRSLLTWLFCCCPLFLTKATGPLHRLSVLSAQRPSRGCLFFSHNVFTQSASMRSSDENASLSLDCNYYCFKWACHLLVYFIYFVPLYTWLPQWGRDLVFPGHHLSPGPGTQRTL